MTEALTVTAAIVGITAGSFTIFLSGRRVLKWLNRKKTPE